MEYDKINNLLGSESKQLPKFVTRQYVKVNSLSNTYNEYKSITFKTPMLRADLYDYSDAYILVNGTVMVSENHPRDRPVILKNNAPFISCITKINNELIEDAEDLDIFMPMYNLLEYRKNYRKAIGSLYNYYRDELSGDDNNNVVNSNDFQYKNKIIGNMYNVDSTIVPAAAGAAYDANRSGRKEVELVIPLKYLGNFWSALNMPLISCELSLELKWDKNCVITIQQIGVNLDGGNTAAPTNATFTKTIVNYTYQ